MKRFVVGMLIAILSGYLMYGNYSKWIVSLLIVPLSLGLLLAIYAVLMIIKPPQK